MFTEDASSDSDYNVEQYIRPKRVRQTINDDSADLLGNFDATKRKEILAGTYEKSQLSADGNPSDIDENNKTQEDSPNPSNDESSNSSVDSNEENTDSNDDDDEDTTNTNLSKEQLALLLRGSSKVNRHVLYVTNLSFDTTKEDLERYFGTAGAVKSVRIPKKRRGGFAFVEMTDLDSFQRGFQLHNTILDKRTIRVQISEAGKKKSANKKNIIKQKNRKLAEMRNEAKTFTKSGKFYNKTLKKEKAKELLAKQRWRKKPGPGGGAKT